MFSGPGQVRQSNANYIQFSASHNCLGESPGRPAVDNRTALRRELSSRIVQGSKSQQIIIAGIHGGNRSLCALKLSLAEFDDGAEAQLVTRLCEGECLSGLLPKLIGNCNAPKCGLCVQDGDAHVAGNGVGEVLRLLLGGLLTQPRLL